MINHTNRYGRFFRSVFRFGTACLIFISPFALAEEDNDQDTIEEIVIVAHPLSAEGLAQQAIVLEGQELEAAKDISIGGTLGNLPGIRSSSFGPAVGRPVIHGLGSARVRVMEDRIDALDVSVTSADHAVGVEPFVADRIEVLTGASTLLYGSGAIGGVVDVHTGRIPHTQQPLSGGVQSFYDDNSEGWNTTSELNGSVGNFSWHIDATVKEGDDYDIPGFAESARFIAREEAEEEEHEDEDEDEHEHEEEEEVRGTLPGSDHDTKNFAFGGSYVADWGFFGISISDTDSDYGLPGHGHHEEGHDEDEEEEEEEHEEEEEGNPVLELESTRTDVEFGLIDPFGPFTALNVRFGHNDYEHQEIEGSGEVATTYENDAWELRSELVYELENWRGAFGLQHTNKDFSAVGEEAFIAPVETVDTGVFWVGEYGFDSFDLELGARVNRLEHDSVDFDSESFTDFPGSIGFVVPLDNRFPGWNAGFQIDYSNRAPIAEELYSNGAHLATNSFEIGDPNLDSETALSFSANFRYVSDRWRTAVTVYHIDFTDFIYEQANGEEEDELPVFVFLQNDATFTGVDFMSTFQAMQWDGGSLDIGVQLDVVDAEISGASNNNVPRLPSERYGFKVGLQHKALRANLSYLRSNRQNDIGSEELITSGYEDLNVSVEYDVFKQENTSVVLFLRGKNLTDDEQRDHTSFLKDVAPLPGRSIQFGARVRF
ncbi:MAG: TonB-dependent receptor [Pseudomonadota bacterium]